LSEARDADLLLHVTDAADPERDLLIDVVNGVLDEIGADEVPQLMVFNKIDLLNANGPAAEDQAPMIHDLTFRQVAPRIDRDADGVPTAVWLSAASGEGLDLLRRAISERLAGARVHAELRLPPRAGRLRARLIELGAVKSERYDEHGWRLDIDAPRDLLLPLAGDVRGDDARLFRDWLDAA
jgi:GTP-binding protein HflX